jgi:hypothetical protein
MSRKALLRIENTPRIEQKTAAGMNGGRFSLRAIPP